MTTQDKDKSSFSCEIPLRWGDMDAFGHVNNTLYLRYCEEARFQWLSHAGVRITPDCYPVVVMVTCNFLRPLFYPDTLRIDCFATEPGRSSLMAYYEMFTRAEPDAPAAEASSKVVWVDGEGKSRPLPDDIRAWFEPESFG